MEVSEAIEILILEREKTNRDLKYVTDRVTAAKYADRSEALTIAIDGLRDLQEYRT